MVVTRVLIFRVEIERRQTMFTGCTPIIWLIMGGFLVAVLGGTASPGAWAEGIRAADAMDAISSGRQKFVKGLRGALASVSAQKDTDNLVEDLLADFEDKEEQEDEVEDEIGEKLTVLDLPNVKTLEIRLPEVDITENGSSSLCTSTSLTEAVQDIVGVIPLINQDAVTHLALYGCPDQAASNEDYWSCTTKNSSGICQGSIAVMFEWSRDQCDSYLAVGDAITVGGAFMHNVVLMVQYKSGGFVDDSGLSLKIMLSIDGDNGVIRAVEYYSRALKNPNCETSEPSSSDELTNDVALSSSSSMAIEGEIASDIDNLQSILETNSAWMSSSESRSYGGESSYQQYGGVDINNALNEELVYPTSASDWTLRLRRRKRDSGSSIPASGLDVVRGWGPAQLSIGQVSGLATDSSGRPTLLHRAGRMWNHKSFDEEGKFTLDDPISSDVICTLDPKTGNMLKSWGKGLFFMPQGLHIDHEDNTWITDVALHQVFKYLPDAEEPSLTLGERFEPGSDREHFCKPTDVAVDSRTGDFFVADGFCNSRILKFSSDGRVLMEITAENLPEGFQVRSFQIPHSLALIESRDIICVADRENARILCFNLNSGVFERQITSPMFGAQIFAISYNSDQDVLYAANGGNEGVSPLAFTISLETGEILNTWGPQSEFSNVNDIATYSPDGTVYVGEIGPNEVWKFKTAFE